MISIRTAIFNDYWWLLEDLRHAKATTLPKGIRPELPAREACPLYEPATTPG